MQLDSVLNGPKHAETNSLVQKEISMTSRMQTLIMQFDSVLTSPNCQRVDTTPSIDKIQLFLVSFLIPYLNQIQTI